MLVLLITMCLLSCGGANVKANIPLNLSPMTSTIFSGGVQKFNVSRSGYSVQSVKWTASGGAITEDGIFVAPFKSGKYTITATSNTDSTKSAVALVNVVESNPSVVSFISDDGNDADASILLPVFKAADVPCACALTVESQQSAVSKKLHLELQNQYGWEMLSHTVTHPYLSKLNDIDLDIELRNSKNSLQQMGFNIASFVYPYGNYNSHVIEFTKHYYSSAYTADNNFLFSPLKLYEIGRYELNLYDAQANKLLVDKAIAGDHWLVFLTHSIRFDTPAKVELLADLISYISLVKGIPIVNPSVALANRLNFIGQVTQ